MSRNKKDIWFPAKKYGFGWGLPVTWQGWAVFALYFVFLIVGVVLVDQWPWLLIPFIIYVFLLSGLLIFICWKKGEKLALRWGGKL